MGTRYFANPFPDYGGGPIQRCDDHIKGLIQSYVNLIVENTKPDRNTDQRGDLYVGDAGNKSCVGGCAAQMAPFANGRLARCLQVSRTCS